MKKISRAQQKKNASLGNKRNRKKQKRKKTIYHGPTGPKIVNCACGKSRLARHLMITKAGFVCFDCPKLEEKEEKEE